MSLSIITQPNTNTGSTIYTYFNNGTFEGVTDLTSLEFFGTFSSTITNSVSRSGTDSLIVVNGNNTTFNQISNFKLPLILPKAKYYYISAYVFINDTEFDSTKNSTVLMNVRDFTNVEIVKSQIYKLNRNINSWTRLDCIVKSNNNTASSGFLNFDLNTANVRRFTIYIDDISVEEIDPILPVYNPIWIRSYSELNNPNNFKFLYTVNSLKDSLIGKARLIPSIDNNLGVFDASTYAKNNFSFDLNYSTTSFASAYHSVDLINVGIQEELNGGVVSSVINAPLRLIFLNSFEAPNLILGSKVSHLNLPGLIVSPSPAYYVKTINKTGNLVNYIELCNDPLLTVNTTATGTFSANGYVQVQETYIPIQTSNTITTNSVKLINAVRSYSDYLKWNNGYDYILDSINKPFLNNLHSTSRNIRLDEYETLSFLSANYLMPSYYKVTKYDSSGIIGTDTYPYTLVFSAENLRLDIGTGTKNLNINSSVKYYTVQIFDESDNQLGQTITYTIIDNCDSNIIRMMWLNENGVFCYYNFKKIKFITKTENFSFNKFLDYGYSTSDRGEAIFHSQNNDTYTLITDFINDKETEYIKSFFTSPEIYRFNEYNEPIPMILTTDVFEYKRPNYDRVKQYKVELRDAHKKMMNI